MTWQVSDTDGEEECSQTIEILEMYTVVYGKRVESRFKKKSHVYYLGCVWWMIAWQLANSCIKGRQAIID